MNTKTIKLYDNDSYQTEFEAAVISCTQAGDQYVVVLDQTLFFPESGGQSADTGLLDQIPVTDVQIQGDIITHYLPSPLSVGMTVAGKIDWPFRYSNMQQHTGEHIVSGLIHQIFGYSNVGFHLGSQSVTLDFNGYLGADELEQIEQKANAAICQNIEVIAQYPSADMLSSMEYRSKLALIEDVRIVTIPGYDVCACCAPHVKRTGEIGMMKITDAIKYKGGIRISILCGERALMDYRQKQRQLTEISVLLSAKQESVSAAVARLKKELFDTKGALIDLQDEWVRIKADTVRETKDSLCIFTEALDAQVHRKYVNLLLPKCGRFCAVFAGNDQDGYRYIIASVTEDVRPLAKKLNARFGAKGGGTFEMIQGSIAAPGPEIEKELLS